MSLFVTLFEEKGWEAFCCIGAVYRDNRLLGYHGWAIFKDEDGNWRIFESTLDIPPSYPDGYPKIDPEENRWGVGNLIYEAWIKFDRKAYYEWGSKEVDRMKDYLRLRRKEKERKQKYEAIEESWKVRTKPLKRREKSLLAKLRWRK